MTEGRQPFTAQINTLAKGPSTYDPLARRSVPAARERNDVGGLVRAMAVRREQRGNARETNFVGHLMSV
jgi:hypothetical protein